MEFLDEVGNEVNGMLLCDREGGREEVEMMLREEVESVECDVGLNERGGLKGVGEVVGRIRVEGGREGWKVVEELVGGVLVLREGRVGGRVEEGWVWGWRDVMDGGL